MGICTTLANLSRQLRHLVEQRLALARSILDHLVTQVIDLLTGLGRGVALRRLDAADLHLEEELGHLDGEAAADAADAGLGGEVDVELVLEGLQVSGGQVGVVGGELVEASA